MGEFTEKAKKKAPVPRGLFLYLGAGGYFPPDATRSTSVIPPSRRMNRT